jgi:hypothetical protein
MVQNSLVLRVVWQILIRIIFLCLAVWIAAYTSSFALDILKNNLGYVTPDSIFDVNFSDMFISLDFALVFWSGVFFGNLGRKIDYILIAIIFVLGLWEFVGTPNATLAMHLGLVGAVVFGNAIGFGLKLLRQRFLPNIKV